MRYTRLGVMFTVAGAALLLLLGLALSCAPGTPTPTATPTAASLGGLPIPMEPFDVPTAVPTGGVWVEMTPNYRTFVATAEPTTTHNTEPIVRVRARNGTYEEYALLHFDTSAMTGTITAAVLSLKAEALGYPATLTICWPDTTWVATDTWTTFVTKTCSLDITGTLSTAGWIDFDVTGIVTSNVTVADRGFLGK